MARATKQMVSNVAWGIRNGVGFGLAFFTIAIGLFVTTGGRAFEANGATIGSAFLVYVGGGAAAGAVVGIFRDTRKGPVAKILVAVLAAVPVSFAGLYAVEGGNWRSVEPVVVAAGALIFGLGAAGVFWEDY